MGSRYGGLKQVDKIGPAGETITDYSVFDAKRAGFDKVVFVIRKSIEADFREIFQRNEKHMEVEYVFQELDAVPPGIQISTERTKPWGTGHAVWVARKAINTPFAVINADDFYGAQSYRVVADFLKDGTIPEKDKYCMIGFPLRNTLSEFGHVSRGICEVDEHQFLKGIVERTKIQYTTDKSSIIFYDENEQPHLLSGNETVSMNFWGFSPAIFDFLEKQFDEFIRLNAQNTKAEFYLPTSVNELIRAKSIKVKVLNSPDSWFGVTYKEDRDVTIQRIRQLIEKGQYPSQLWR
ncbi:MAG: sugar phosphate nucleotidyltransferase [Bacteroidales bacterium]